MNDKHPDERQVEDRAGRIARAVLLGSILPTLCLLLAHGLVWPSCGPVVLH